MLHHLSSFCHRHLVGSSELVRCHTRLTKSALKRNIIDGFDVAEHASNSITDLLVGLHLKRRVKLNHFHRHPNSSLTHLCLNLAVSDGGGWIDLFKLSFAIFLGVLRNNIVHVVTQWVNQRLLYRRQWGIGVYRGDRLTLCQCLIQLADRIGLNITQHGPSSASAKRCTEQGDNTQFHSAQIFRLFTHSFCHFLTQLLVNNVGTNSNRRFCSGTNSHRFGGEGFTALLQRLFGCHRLDSSTRTKTNIVDWVGGKSRNDINIWTNAGLTFSAKSTTSLFIHSTSQSSLSSIFWLSVSHPHQLRSSVEDSVQFGFTHPTHEVFDEFFLVLSFLVTFFVTETSFGVVINHTKQVRIGVEVLERISLRWLQLSNGFTAGLVLLQRFSVELAINTKSSTCFISAVWSECRRLHRLDGGSTRLSLNLLRRWSRHWHLRQRLLSLFEIERGCGSRSWLQFLLSFFKVKCCHVYSMML